MAAPSRRRVRHRRFVLVAQIEYSPCSLGKDLQAYVNHGMCVADNVASAGEEQVDMLVQFPCSADIEREVGIRSALFR